MIQDKEAMGNEHWGVNKALLKRAHLFLCRQSFGGPCHTPSSVSLADVCLLEQLLGQELRKGKCLILDLRPLTNVMVLLHGVLAPLLLLATSLLTNISVEETG